MLVYGVYAWLGLFAWCIESCMDGCIEFRIWLLSPSDDFGSECCWEHRPRCGVWCRTLRPRCGEWGELAVGFGGRCECGTDVECVGKIAEYLNYACRHLPFPKFFCTMFWNLCSLPIQNRAKGCASHTESLSDTPFPVRFGRWHRFYTVTDLDPPCTTARYAVVPTLRNTCQYCVPRSLV